MVRAPLRVALGGGGTDLRSYYRDHGGLVVSTAIDKYVHMTVSATQFRHRFLLKHLAWEEVDDPREVAYLAAVRYGPGVVKTDTTASDGTTLRGRQSRILAQGLATAPGSFAGW